MEYVIECVSCGSSNLKHLDSIALGEDVWEEFYKCLGCGELLESRVKTTMVSRLKDRDGSVDAS